MTEAVRQLRDLNRRIRAAATSGAVEDMMMLDETRRQFLDSLPTPKGAQGSGLIAALEEAANDNKDFIRALEGAMEQSRARGRTTSQARRRYHQRPAVFQTLRPHSAHRTLPNLFKDTRLSSDWRAVDHFFADLRGKGGSHFPTHADDDRAGYGRCRNDRLCLSLDRLAAGTRGKPRQHRSRD